MTWRRRTVVAVAAFLAAGAALVAWRMRGDAVVDSEQPRASATSEPSPSPWTPPTPRTKSEKAPFGEREQPSTLVVRVFDEANKTVRGAVIVLRRGGAIVASATSDGDGAAAFLVAPPKPYDVEATKAGVGVETKVIDESTYGHGELSLEMRLIDGVAAHGMVVDDTTGRPVVGARVRVMQSEDAITREDADRSRMSVWADVRTNDAGTFELRAVPIGKRDRWPNLTFVVNATGYADCYSTVRIANIRPPELPTIEVTPTATVRGVVLLPDGTPAAGARVTPGLLLEYVAHPEVATTDAAGGFELHDVKVGARCRLEIVSAGGVARGDIDVVMRGAPPFELRLVEAASFVVRALGHGGRRLDPGSFQASVHTRGKGFTRGLGGHAPGRFDVAVEAKGYLPWCGVVDAHAGVNDVTVDLEAKADVAGRVVDDAGKVVPSAEIQVRFPEGIYIDDRRVHADADGRFVVPCVAGGTYLLRVDGDAYVRDAREVVAPAQDVVLTAVRTSTVAVHLRLPPGAAPPDWANGIDADGGKETHVQDGVVRVLGVRPGPQQMRVQFQTFDVLSLDIDAKPGETIDVNSATLVALPRTVELKLRAVDAAGAPVAGALLVFGDHPCSSNSHVDDAGVAVVNAAIGRLSVRATVPGLGGATRVDVTEATRELVVTLRPTRRVWVRVERPLTGGPRARRVEIVDDVGVVWDVPTFDSRLRASTEAPPGRWRVRAVDGFEKTLAETALRIDDAAGPPIEVVLAIP